MESTVEASRMKFDCRVAYKVTRLWQVYFIFFKYAFVTFSGPVWHWARPSGDFPGTVAISVEQHRLDSDEDAVITAGNRLLLRLTTL